MNIANNQLSPVKGTLPTCIFQQHCVHCKKPFAENVVIVCVGSPHHVLLHKNCAIYYDYFGGYKWPNPYTYYELFSNT